MKDCKTFSAALVAALLAGTAALPQTVTLESFDGTISITGDLLDFDGENYEVATAVGPMLIDAFQVTCIGEVCPPQELLRSEFMISGSSSLASRLIPALLEGLSFELDADVVMATGEGIQPSISISSDQGETLAEVALAGDGSTDGIRDLLSGEASLAVSTRPMQPREREELDASGRGLGIRTETILALDGLLVVSSASNPVRAVTEEMIGGIFSGQITNWQQIGGPNAPISAYLAEEDLAPGSVFAELVMDPAGLEVSPNVQVLPSDADVSDTVADDPFAIGISSFSNARNAQSLAIAGTCGIQTPPNAFTIKTEEYPLTRRLYLYQADKPIPQMASRFVEFIRSPDAQDIIADAGFIDQGVSSLSVNDQGLRFVSSVMPSEAETTLEDLRSMMGELIQADRLSITYRFEQGSTRLDSRASADLDRLAEMAEAGELENKEVLLIGFTDSVGRADLNRSLSEARAEQVRESLIDSAPSGTFDDVSLRVLGFGEMSPLGCNETVSGRRINRRVEVWVRDTLTRAL